MSPQTSNLEEVTARAAEMSGQTECLESGHLWSPLTTNAKSSASHSTCLRCPVQMTIDTSVSFSLVEASESSEEK